MLPTAVKSKMIFLKSSKLGEYLIPPSPHYSAAGVRCWSLLLPSQPLSSLQTLSELPRGITMGKTWQLMVHLLPQKSDFVCFAFLRRWNTWRIREITSPNQQTSDYSTAQAATQATVRLWCLALPEVMGQNILSDLFLYFLFGWLVPADIAVLKGNSLRDKQKFSWLATLSTLTSKLNTWKCLIVPLLISNGRILIFLWKKIGGWIHPRCKFASKRSGQIYINGMCLLLGRRLWSGCWLNICLAKLSLTHQKISDERILTYHKPRLQQYIQRMQPTKGIHR